MVRFQQFQRLTAVFSFKDFVLILKKFGEDRPVQLHIVDDEDLPFFRSHHAFPSPEDVSGSRRRTKTAPREERPSLSLFTLLCYT